MTSPGARAMSAAMADKVIIGGAPEGFDAGLVLREMARADGPVVHIARDDKRLESMRAALVIGGWRALMAMPSSG